MQNFTPEEKIALDGLMFKVAHGTTLNQEERMLLDKFQRHFLAVIEIKYLTPYERINPKDSAKSVFWECLSCLCDNIRKEKYEAKGILKAYFEKICANVNGEHYKKEQKSLDSNILSRSEGDSNNLSDEQEWAIFEQEEMDNENTQLNEVKVIFIERIKNQLSEKDQQIIDFLFIKHNSELFVEEYSERSATKNVMNFFDISEDAAKQAIANAKKRFMKKTGEDKLKNIDFNKDIIVKSANGAAKCIIDCELGGRGFNLQSNQSTATVIDGFTIINGSYQGGGIAAYQSSPTIQNSM